MPSKLHRGTSEVTLKCLPSYTDVPPYLPTYTGVPPKLLNFSPNIFTEACDTFGSFLEMKNGDGQSIALLLGCIGMGVVLRLLSISLSLLLHENLILQLCRL